MYYGGIDRVYGEISKESADIILDLIEEYEELVEQCPSAFRSDDEETSVFGQVKKGKSYATTNNR